MSARRPKRPVVQYAEAGAVVDGVRGVLITAIVRVRAAVELVGSVEVRLEGYCAEMRRLVVDPKWRRRGIGRTLYQRAWEVAVREAKWTLAWQVGEKNLEALAFYLGAQVGTGARVVFDQNGEFWMVLEARPLTLLAVRAALERREMQRRQAECPLPNGARPCAGPEYGRKSVPVKAPKGGWV